MVDRKIITGGQMRAARAFLRWSADDLAEASNVGVATIRRAEAQDDAPNLLVNNMDAIRRALETAGIEFTNGDAPGVRLIKQKKPRTPR
jgi:transcriptional regulator with XRE-family HTH domain